MTKNNTHVVLIGINRYADGDVGDLRGARNDAIAWWRLCTRYLRVPAEQITVLASPPLSAAELGDGAERSRLSGASREELLDAMRRLQGTLDGDDDAAGLLTYSGHGVVAGPERTGEAGEDLALCPEDVKLAGGGTVAFGPVCASEAGGTREVAERVAQTLSRAGVHASVVEGGVQNTLWRKLIVNAAVNPICALAGVRNGALRTGALRVLADAVVVEACAVARAKSVGDGAADTGAMLEFVHDVIDKTAENLCSMACDVEAGRVTEADAITGFLVRTAQAHKVPIPRIETLHALVKARDGAV